MSYHFVTFPDEMPLHDMEGAINAGFPCAFDTRLYRRSIVIPNGNGPIAVVESSLFDA